MTNNQSKQTTKKMPEDLEEWVIENFRAVENDTLPSHQRKKFLDFIEKNQDDPILNRLYERYEEMKN